MKVKLLEKFFKRTTVVNQPSYKPEMNLKDEDIRDFISKVKENSRYDFSNYSEKSFKRRIEKILSDHDMSIQQLVKEIMHDGTFLEQIVKEITVNTTELFRDKDTWIDILNFIKRFFASNQEMHIWSAGCSNGLEVYSLLVLLNELDVLDRCHIYGSDLNTTMLEKAKKGEYPYRHDNDFFVGFQNILPTLPFDIDIDKYFSINTRNYKCTVKPKFRKQTRFKQSNLVDLINPFDINYDMILCRNVLIYFNHPLQEKLFHFFHRNLSDNGGLILGVHEGMLGPVAEKYTKQGQVYIRL